jgi:hypothetical protein
LVEPGGVRRIHPTQARRCDGSRCHGRSADSLGRRSKVCDRRSDAAQLRAPVPAARRDIPESSGRGIDAGFRAAIRVLAPAAGMRIFGTGTGRREQGRHRKQQR